MGIRSWVKGTGSDSFHPFCACLPSDCLHLFPLLALTVGYSARDSSHFLYSNLATDGYPHPHEAAFLSDMIRSQTMSKDSFKHNMEDSSLMFAVIFDPEGGLETFSGTQLLALSPDYDVTEPQRPSVRNFLRGGKVKKKKEPFAIFGSREPMYIDIRSSRLYEKYIRNSNFDPAADSSNTSVDWSDKSSQLLTSHKTPPKPLNQPSAKPTSENLTPRAVFTFAALWNPEAEGEFSQHGTPVLTPDGYLKHLKAGTQPIETNQVPFPSKGPILLDQPDSLDTPFAASFSSRILFHHPSRDPLMRRAAIPSSVFEGSKDPWNHSTFEPLRGGVPFDPQASFAEFQVDETGELVLPAVSWDDDGPLFGKDGSSESSIEDEGFFEDSPHFDCDPHLPSRFSVTTTSTNTYIAVDPRSVPPPRTVERVLENRVNPPRGLTSRRTLIRPSRLSLTTKKPTPTPLPPTRERKVSRAESVAKMSKALIHKLSKRPQDEKWVLVEVQPMVTSRVLEEEEED